MRRSDTAGRGAQGYFTHPRFRDRCGSGLLAGRGHRTEVRETGGLWRIVVSCGRCRLRIELQGGIRFHPDDSGIEAMEPGARLVVEEEAGSKRVLVVTAEVAGEPHYRWRVDGCDVPFEGEARPWLAGVLVEISRTTGLRARERVVRYLESGGVTALLEEVRRISSGHVRGLYLAEALGWRPLPLEGAETLLRAAGETRAGGQDLARALYYLPSAALEEPRVREAFAAAVRAIGSDHETGRLLRAFLERRDLTPEAWATLLSMARGIRSDREVAALLVAALDAPTAERPLPKALFTAVHGMRSDSERRRALQAVIVRGPLDEATVLACLRSVERMRSDADAASLLVELARRVRPEGLLREEFLQTAGRLRSLSERERAVTASKRARTER